MIITWHTGNEGITMAKYRVSGCAYCDLTSVVAVIICNDVFSTSGAGRWSVSAACCVTREPPPLVFTCAVFAVCGSGAFKLP